MIANQINVSKTNPQPVTSEHLPPFTIYKVGASAEGWLAKTTQLAAMHLLNPVIA